MSTFVFPILSVISSSVIKNLSAACVSPAFKYISASHIKKRKTYTFVKVGDDSNFDTGGFEVLETITSNMVIHINGPCGPWSIVTKIENGVFPDTRVYVSHYFVRGHITTIEGVEQMCPAFAPDKWEFDPSLFECPKIVKNSTYSTHVKSKIGQSDIMCFRIYGHPFSLILNRTEKSAILGVMHGDHRSNVGKIINFYSKITVLQPVNYDGWWYSPYPRKMP